MIYPLYCAKERDQTYHSVEDSKDDEKIRIIKCLSCGHIQENVILSIRESVEKSLYDACEESDKYVE